MLMEHSSAFDDAVGRAGQATMRLKEVAWASTSDDLVDLKQTIEVLEAAMRDLQANAFRAGVSDKRERAGGNAYCLRSPFDRLISAAVEARISDSPAPVRSTRLAYPLTGRELDVLRLLPTSLTCLDMASVLFVSHNTIKTHLRNIYMKLDVTSRSEAIERAIDAGLL
jgi:ATP/maltotriose-dependent transcriptional regulator MalT